MTANGMDMLRQFWKSDTMKNKILKTITAISVVLVFAGMCGADSNSPIPCVLMLVGMSWLILFMYANRIE